MKKIIQENKKLLSNIIYSGIFQGANWFVPLLTTPYLIKTIGIERFGLISFALTFFTYLLTITDYGFNISITRKIALNKQNKKYISLLFMDVMFARIILCVFSFICLVICIALFDKFSKEAAFFIVSFLIVIARALFPNWYFQGIGEIKVIAILNFSTQLIFVPLLVLLVKDSNDYIYVILLQGIASFISSIIALSIVFKNISFYKPTHIRLKKTLIDGYYPFLTSASIIGYARTNILILGLLTNDTITGYYSAVERIIFFIRQIIGTVVSTVYPHVCYLTTLGNKEIKVFFLNIYSIFVVTILSISVTLYIFSEDIVKIFIGTQSIFALESFKLLSLSLIPIIINTVFHLIMTAFGLNRLNANIYFISVFINLILSYFGIKYFSNIGAGIAVIITELFIVISLAIGIESKKKYSIFFSKFYL